MVRQPLSGKAVKNEGKYPYIVELSAPEDKLDVEVSRRMMDFHSFRKIQVQHGRRIVIEDQIYFRWCFSDSETASAFKEQFGGEVLQPKTTEKLIAPTVRRLRGRTQKKRNLVRGPMSGQLHRQRPRTSKNECP